MNRISSFVVPIVVLAAWSALVWSLLLSPRISRVPPFFGSFFVYNVGHAVLFGVQALLIGLALRPDPPSESRPLWTLAALLAVAYGVYLEWRQGSVIGRSSSWADVVTDAVGAFGAPWILALGTPFTRRSLIVLAAALASASAASLGL